MKKYFPLDITISKIYSKYLKYWIFIICLSPNVIFAQYIDTENSELLFKKPNILTYRGIALGFQYSYSTILPYKGTNDYSDLNIRDYHNRFNLVAEYFIFKDISAQFTFGLIVIPKQQRIDSISFTPGSGLGGIQAKGNGYGGALIPVALGVKKTFLNGAIRPYISTFLGFTYIKIGIGTGTGSIYTIEEDIDYQSEYVFSYNFESGIQFKVSKSVRFDFGVNLFGSPKISPTIGNIHNYQGFSILGGINFILNQKK